jgi:hypothetical protein
MTTTVSVPASADVPPEDVPIDPLDAEIEAVDAALVEIQVHRDELKERARDLTTQRNVLLVRKEMAQMPAAKRDALILMAQGIASAEAVMPPKPAKTPKPKKPS